MKRVQTSSIDIWQSACAPSSWHKRCRTVLNEAHSRTVKTSSRKSNSTGATPLPGEHGPLDPCITSCPAPGSLQHFLPHPWIPASPPAQPLDPCITSCPTPGSLQHLLPSPWIPAALPAPPLDPCITSCPAPGSLHHFLPHPWIPASLPAPPLDPCSTSYPTPRIPAAPPAPPTGSLQHLLSCPLDPCSTSCIIVAQSVPSEMQGSAAGAES